MMSAPLPIPAPPTERRRNAGFGIYMHWPFCRAKCPYCDFNSHVRATVDQARWRHALLAELDFYATETNATDTNGREVTSVFFGGGTPSLMAPETVAAVIERIADRWPLANNAEITLEANPISVEAAGFAAFRAAGVTRVSLGVQALDDDALAFLGRQHSAREALAAVAVARRHFSRWSFDMIYARPDQTVAAWTAELSRALAEGPAHLSLYQLTIEKGTVFHGAWRRGELVPPGENRAADLFEATQDMLVAAGRPAYEISNHARPGEECRHNLTYWRYGDYVGVGPGAHGRLSRRDDSAATSRKIATRQHRAPEAWLAAVEKTGHGTRERRDIDVRERLVEMTMMGLRLRAGIERAAFRREMDAEPEEVLPAAALHQLIDGGFLELDSTALRATDAGRQCLDALLARLLA